MRIPIKLAGLVSVILIGAWGCSKEEPPVGRACPASNANDYYFPAGVADSGYREIDGFLREWYSKQLRAMGEPSLSCGERTAETTYRFTWLRTFHHPVCVRIEKKGSSIALHAIELDGAGGYEPGNVAKRVQKQLSQADYSRLTDTLGREDFWQKWGHRGFGGLDGAEWILERSHQGRYQVADQWSPESGEYRDVCCLFLEYAGLLTPETKVY